MGTGTAVAKIGTLSLSDLIRQSRITTSLLLFVVSLVYSSTCGFGFGNDMCRKVVKSEGDKEEENVPNDDNKKSHP